MKKYFLMVFAILAMRVSAQELKEEPIGKVELVATYSLDQLCSYSNDDAYDDWRVKSTVRLEVGDGKAHSYVEEERNKMISSFLDFQKNNKWHLEAQIHPLLGETYICYPQAGKLTQVVNLDAAGVYSYVEKIPKMEWAIQPEHKTVLGYDCQKATCRFRGRDYTAWFAADIPLGYGPWKFGGLPGLILEVADTKGEYLFVATGVEKAKTDIQIKWIGEDNMRSIKREKAMKMEKMAHKDHGAYAADYNIIFSWEGVEHLPMPYYPLELE